MIVFRLPLAVVSTQDRWSLRILARLLPKRVRGTNSWLRELVAASRVELSSAFEIWRIGYLQSFILGKFWIGVGVVYWTSSPSLLSSFSFFLHPFLHSMESKVATIKRKKNQHVRVTWLDNCFDEGHRSMDPKIHLLQSTSFLFRWIGTVILWYR